MLLVLNASDARHFLHVGTLQGYFLMPYFEVE